MINVQYDERQDRYHFGDGIEVSGELLRLMFSDPTPTHWYRIIKRDDGAVHCEVKTA
jgi:hypothetical protein